MPTLFISSENWAFVLTVNVYEKTKNSGKVAEF
jgi:hypothetical protein